MAQYGTYVLSGVPAGTLVPGNLLQVPGGGQAIFSQQQQQPTYVVSKGPNVGGMQTLQNIVQLQNGQQVQLVNGAQFVQRPQFINAEAARNQAPQFVTIQGPLGTQQTVQIRPAIQQVEMRPAQATFIQATGPMQAGQQVLLQPATNQQLLAAQANAAQANAAQYRTVPQGTILTQLAPANRVAAAANAAISSTNQVLAAQPAGQSLIALPPGTTVATAQPGGIITASDLLRSGIRIPKLGTVATYNPATGVYNPTAGALPTTVAIATGHNGQPTTLQQVAAASAQPRPGGGGGGMQQMLVLQQQQGAPQGGNGSVRPVLQYVAATGMQTATVQGGLPQPLVLTNPAAATSLPLDSSKRTTVLKVPVNGGPASLDLTHLLQGVAANGGGGGGGSVAGLLQEQHILQAAKHAALSTLGADGALLQARKAAATSADGTAKVQQDGGPDGGKDALTEQDTNTGNMASAMANGVLFDSDGAAPAAAAAAAAAAAQGAAANGADELHLVLACIGVELARNGMALDSVVGSGWLAKLGPAELQVLAEAYHAEVQALALGGVGSAATAAGVNTNNGAAVNNGMSSNSRRSSAGSLGAVAGGAASNSNGGGDFKRRTSSHSLPADDLPAKPALLAGGGASEPVSFDAFSYGFFGANGNGGGGGGGMDTLRALEDDGTSSRGSRDGGAARGLLGGAKPPGASGRPDDVASRFANLDLGCGFF